MKLSIRLTALLPTLALVGCFFGTTQSENSPPRFLLQYVCDTRDEINTFEGYIVKNLEADGTKKADFKITPSDSAKILEKLKEIHFFEMKSPYPSRPWVGDKPVSRPNLLRVAFGNREKCIEWDDIRGTHSPVKELHELRDFLLNIIESTAEWKALPPARLFEL